MVMVENFYFIGKEGLYMNLWSFTASLLYCFSSSDSQANYFDSKVSSLCKLSICQLYKTASENTFASI